MQTDVGAPCRSRIVFFLVVLGVIPGPWLYPYSTHTHEHDVQGRTADALAAFAEDVYHCSCEWGSQDVRTSVGFYSLAKCCQVGCRGCWLHLHGMT